MRRRALLLISFAFALVSAYAQTQTVGVFTYEEAAYEGYTLLTPNSSMKSYLINNCGEVVNEWESEYRPGLSSYLLEDGSLLRTAQVVSNSEQNSFSNGGFGGRIEKYNWEGDLVWFLPWATENMHQHHDIEQMPNGNILIISWESHSYAEALEMGKLPNNAENPVWCLNITEVEPTGTSGGNVVWSWSAWDHLVQDTDPTLPNYAIVSEEPRKFNINYTSGSGATNGAGASDWMHVNSIDYNSALDQIIVSSLKFSEFWIIDHSLSTEEAATEAGDLLYRFGNPETYGRGTETDRILFSQHDAYWIEEGVDAGKIMVFNNGKNRPEGEYSSVIVVDVPEFNGATYQINEGVAFEPSSYDWRYPEVLDAEFYAQNISGSSRLPNGNTLICEGPEGRIFEVTPDEEIVWEYINAENVYGPVTQGEEPGNNAVFRANKYGLDYPAFEGRDLTPYGVIELDSWITGCTIGIEEINSSSINSFPNPFTEFTTIQSFSDGRIEVYSIRGELVENLGYRKDKRMSLGHSYDSGVYIVKHISTSGMITSKLIIKQ